MTFTPTEPSGALNVGPLILGGNVFGWTADRDESFRILDRFVDAGGKAIDTADVYSAWADGNSGGESETVLGEWLQARPGVRERILINTKVGMWEQRPGLGKQNIAEALDASLSRLHTDYIDVYYAHRDDEKTAQDETFGAFHAAVRAGKVRAVGVSNFSAERVRTAAQVIATNGFTPISFSQDQYNLVNRAIETTLVPALTSLGILETPYSALASGFLTGKYRAGAAVESARAGVASAYLSDQKNVSLLAVLDDVAAAHHTSVTAVALAWLRMQPNVAAPLASARTADQLGTLIDSFTLELSAEQLRSLDGVSAG